MRTEIALPKKFEIYIPDLDNRVLIENRASGVIISATRDNVSEQRKAFFIRHLAAEGYIPDRYEWFSESAEDGFLGVKWIANASTNESQTAFGLLRKLYTRRNVFYCCLFATWFLFVIWSARHVTHGLGL